MNVYYRKRRRYEEFYDSGAPRRIEVAPGWSIDPVTTSDPAEWAMVQDAWERQQLLTVTAQDGTERQVMITSIVMDTISSKTAQMTVTFVDPGLHPVEMVPWAKSAAQPKLSPPS